MQAQAFNRKQVSTSLEWALTLRPVIHSQYKARSVAAASPYPQEAAVEEVQWPSLQEKLGRHWERTLEEV
jgi:hypothetical protein